MYIFIYINGGRGTQGTIGYSLSPMTAARAFGLVPASLFPILLVASLWPVFSLSALGLAFARSGCHFAMLWDVFS